MPRPSYSSWFDHPNNIFFLIFDIPVGMYMHSIFHSCSVTTVTLGYRFQLYRAIIRPVQ
jgi:hypothetical protein